MLPEIGTAKHRGAQTAVSSAGGRPVVGTLPTVSSAKSPARSAPAPRMQYGRRRRANVRRTRGGGGVRPDSRVGKVLAEFGSTDDWVAKTIVRHQLACIIQSVVRGWIVRRRWHKNPEGVVTELKARIENEAKAEKRRAEMRQKLEVKLLTEKQKSVARTTIDTLFGTAVLAGRPKVPMGKLAGKWGKLSRNMDIAKATAEAKVENDREYVPCDLSDSDYSDAELDNIAAIKMRAKTPPWQRVEHCQWVGQYQKLNQKQSRGNLDVLWDLSAAPSRLEEVTARRKTRDKEAETDEEEGAEEKLEFDPVTDDLPEDLIKGMLAARYEEKWTRMGMDTYVPRQYGKLDVGLVDEKPMKLTAVRPRPDDF